MTTTTTTAKNEGDAHFTTSFTAAENSDSDYWEMDVGGGEVVGQGNFTTMPDLILLNCFEELEVEDTADFTQVSPPLPSPSAVLPFSLSYFHSY